MTIDKRTNCSVCSVERFAGFVAGLEAFTLRSAVGRRALHSLSFSTVAQVLNREYDLTAEVARTLNADIEHALSEVQDISGTVERLAAGEVMDDVQLFEIKHLCLMAGVIRRAGSDRIADTADIVSLLDPNGEGVDTFYIYDSYDLQLARMRRDWPEPTAEQLAEMFDAEDRVRASLTAALKPRAARLGTLLRELGLLDLRIAKCHLSEAEGLCRPRIVDDRTAYTGLFDIETRAALRSRGRDYQPVDVSFGREPCLVTGMNMGGKTVLLRALADAQTMCQYGFPVPAAEARIAPADDVLVSMDDDQDHIGGLSSFAAEMLKTDSIVRELGRGVRALVLIDEPARTTNPTEGRIIVNAVMQHLARAGAAAFVTTHYDGIHGSFPRLRVRGLSEDKAFSSIGDLEGAIDYSLVPTTEEEVPHEALRVARMLGISLFDE